MDMRILNCARGIRKGMHGEDKYCEYGNKSGLYDHMKMLMEKV